MSGWPPLPPDETELEDLLSEHVETVSPPAGLVDRTQRQVQRQLQATGGGWRWVAGGAAALVLVAVGLALMPEPKPETPPELPPEPTAAPSEPVRSPEPSLDPPVHAPPTVAPSPSPATTPTPTPVPTGELLVPLTGRRADVEADMNYDLLKEQLRAQLIVTGRIEQTGTEKNQATLRVAQILRGKRAMLLRVRASEHVNACMGVPDFTRYDGKDVVLFLRVNQDGSTSLLTGAASLRSLPYHGLLDAQALGSIVKTRRIPGPQLATVVRRRGARVVTWLSEHLPGAADSIRQREVQAALLDDLRAFPAVPDRKDVMGIAEHLRARPRLAPAVLDRLKRYHTTFQHRLGHHTRLPNGQFVNNGYHQHLIFLRFMGGFDPAWTTQVVKRTLARIDRRTAPQVYGQYQAALVSFEEPVGDVKVSITAGPEGGSRLEIRGPAKDLPDGTLLHVSLVAKQAAKPHPEVLFVMVRVQGERFQLRKVYKTETFAPNHYTAQVELILSSQRRAIREFIRRDRGLAKNARVVLGRKPISLGTDEERAAFRKQTRQTLGRYAAALATKQAEVTKQVQGRKIDPAAPQRLGAVLAKFQAHVAKHVGWPEHVTIKQLETAFVETARTLRYLQRGKQAKAEAALARAMAQLRAVQQRLRR